SGPSSSGSARARISAASAARSSSPSPALAASSKIASAGGRDSAGSLPVHLAILYAQDSVISSATSAAAKAGWHSIRRAHPVYPAAAPWVTLVRCIRNDLAP